MTKSDPYLKSDFLMFLSEYVVVDSVRKFLNKFISKESKEKKMDIDAQSLKANPALKEIVKEVVKEELKPDLEKLKQGNQHLQEGNMYLNE